MAKLINVFVPQCRYIHLTCSRGFRHVTSTLAPRGYRNSDEIFRYSTKEENQFDFESDRNLHNKNISKESRNSAVENNTRNNREKFAKPSADAASNKSSSNIDWNREQSRHAYRPRVNPQETSLLLFPGQGSQFVGMGKMLLDYPNVRQLYERASEVLKYDLLDICLNGPKEKLNSTIHCQPAVVVTSLAALEKLKEQNPWAIKSCISAAGYSVGEYSALVFSGALSFDDAMYVVKKRAEAMQKASELLPSRMMTVFFSAEAKIGFACHAAKLYCSQELKMEDSVCEVTNFLYPGCKILSGNAEALKFIEQNAEEFGIKRVQYLPVSGAFHSKLMKPAKDALHRALKSITINDPILPVHSNVNGYKYKTASVIRSLLVEQIYRPVLWEQTMQVMYSRPQGEGFPQTFELGPGRQLGAMLQKINKKAFEQYQAVTV